MTIIKKSKKHMLVFLSIILITFLVFSTGFIWNAKTVTVVADGRSHVVQTHKASPIAIVREAGVTLNSADALMLDTKTLTNGTVITVVRAFPVTVEVQGKIMNIMTTGRTAQAVAEQLGYRDPYYAVEGKSNRPIEAGSTITIAFINKRITQEVRRTIPIETIRVPDSTLSKGQSTVEEFGSPGLAIVREEVLYNGERPIQVRDLSNTIITPMKPRIVKEGTRENTVATSRGVMRYSKVLTMHATAYTVAEGNGDGLTATGIPATRGVVAVDPSFIPLGTRLFIPGYGMAIAADTGSAIIGNKIDLLMDSKQEAFNFGRQNVEVYILQ